MGRSVQAEFWSGGRYAGRVQHQPPTSWRIEDASGAPTYIENDAHEYRRSDEVMIHTVKSPNTGVAWAGDTPVLLVRAYSLWQLDNDPWSQLRQHGEVSPVEVHGRTGWQVRFTDSNSGGEVTYVIDAELGIALSRTVDGHSIELSNPVFDEHFDPAAFEWHGPAREEDRLETSARREYDAKMQAIAQIPRPQVTWLPGSIDARPVDGDPRTGTLALHVIAQYPTVTLRQWLTELGEPELDENQYLQALHRESVGPWTYEIRAYPPLDAEDCTRIIASIVAPEPPDATPAQICAILDRDAAEQADAELHAALGIGRQLDEFLGGNGDVSLLIRTDFSDDAAWRATAAAAMAPGEGKDSDFVACLTCIDNPDNDGLSITALLDRIGDAPPYYVFIADTETITNPEHPILAVDTGPENTGHERGRTFRVMPAQMWSVENNLSISNMDFEDFASASDPNGVYRGF
ncbi:DUF6924 domain-containing protein [Nocardia sp. NPDC057272]|uniref:DUF6924 domain-containing protein n=1 Tax=Nocardia sp. NPDC057272 TaxID=3346079 RepID=UPI00363CA614